MLRRTLTITLVLGLAVAITSAGQGFAVGAEPASYTSTFITKYNQWNRNVVRVVQNNNAATRLSQMRLEKRVIQYTDRHLTWLERTQPSRACAVRYEDRYYRAVLGFRNKLVKSYNALLRRQPRAALQHIKAAIKKQNAAHRAAARVVGC